MKVKQKFRQKRRGHYRNRNFQLAKHVRLGYNKSDNKIRAFCSAKEGITEWKKYM